MTTTLIIYRLVSEPHKLFAHVTRSETLDLNGAVVPGTNRTFYALMESSTSQERDRHTIKQFARSELNRPKSRFIGLDKKTGDVIVEPLQHERLPIEWDDTHEMWNV